MEIETKLEFKDYRKLVFICTYRNLIIIVLTLVFFIICIWNFNIASLLSFLLYFSILQIIIHFSAKKHYTTNKALQEKIIYEFTDDKILIKGETFYSEFYWEKIYLIEELKDFILIYQSNSTANIISKKSFGNQIKEFRNSVKHKSIKTKFLK
ncbi:MAG: YcxB family protein [Tannerellaceae bacterium]|jgi:hypothetical protein|nr:YcxB family protein [Tannerellaceae bacterium]